MLHGAGIFTYKTGVIFRANVGKYSIQHMGYIITYMITKSHLSMTSPYF